jgi:hypothetical protein
MWRMLWERKWCGFSKRKKRDVDVITGNYTITFKETKNYPNGSKVEISDTAHGNIYKENNKNILFLADKF